MSDGETTIDANLLARLPLAAKLVVELGCGDGELGRAYKRQNPAAAYIGIEPDEAAAKLARAHLDDVINGGEEQAATMAALDAALGGRRIDVLVLGDRFGRLANPAATLVRWRKRMAAGGVCVASVLNAGHWSRLAEYAGRRPADAEAGNGPRPFTLNAAAALLVGAGWTMADGGPVSRWPEESEAVLAAAAPAARGSLSAYRWILRAQTGAPVQKPLNVFAVTMAKVGGISAVRIEEPLTAMATQLCVTAKWAPQKLMMTAADQPGVLILQRQYFDPEAFVRSMDSLARLGWAIVSEVDDDPREVAGFLQNDFLAFRAAHAVTVSTEPLADVVRQWNPNVAVFPNAAAKLADAPPSTPKGERLRVFFGAFNREGDWAPIVDAIGKAVVGLGDLAEMVVVHDAAFRDALPSSVACEFHDVLPYARYKAVLASCDIALLPLADNRFNRHKSDLKLVECCAAGVVPICSPVVYGDDPRHADVAVFAHEPQAFADALKALCLDVERLTDLRAKGLAYVSGARMQAQQVAVREAFYRGVFARQKGLEAERLKRIAAAQA